jgi:uptake hydrogenase large subunit
MDQRGCSAVSIEGALQIELVCRQRQVAQVSISSSRPLQLPLVFEGKPVADTLSMLPMLYSVCATAQAQAAAIACRQAVGIASDPRLSIAESLLVWCETGREHLWRMLIDWPPFCGEAPDPASLKDLPELLRWAKEACFGEAREAFSLAPVLKLDNEELQRVIASLARTSQQAVLGMAPQAWYALETAETFHQWIEGGGTAPARLLASIRQEGIAALGGEETHHLPAMEIDEIDRRMRSVDARQFTLTPEWNAKPCETTALTRQRHHPLIKALGALYGNGLMTRMAARLLELASIPARLQDMLNRLVQVDLQPQADFAEEGKGIGIVEAARGRLTHRVLVSDGRIKRYQIVAPTEWNFHPHGVVAQGLLGLPAESEVSLQRQASLFINAVDPCVGYGIEIH